MTRPEHPNIKTIITIVITAATAFVLTDVIPGR